MKPVGLVACCKEKVNYPVSASLLYNGEDFREAASLVRSYCDEWGILSAKHGLLMPDETVAPYNQKLKKSAVPLWGAWTQYQIVSRWPKREFLVICDKDYLAAVKGLKYQHIPFNKLGDY